MRVLLGQKIATARTQLEVAEADLVTVRWRLEGCMVRAPGSGTILKKNAEEGNLVNENLSLCELANLSELEVELAIPEREIHKIRPQERCKVRTEAFPDRIYDGVISRVMPVANRLQSAIPIRVKIAVPPEEVKRLPLGMLKRESNPREAFVLIAVVGLSRVRSIE